jgi:hypothetical protein
MSPPASGSKKTSKKPALKEGNKQIYLLGLFLDPEDGDGMFLRNVS